MTLKSLLSRVVPDRIWKKIRLRRILRSHSKAATTCDFLIKEYKKSGKQILSDVKAKKSIDSNKIVWQYWAQGYDKVPDVVSFCLDSINHYCKDCLIIRLSDSNIDDYLDIPYYVKEITANYGRAFFSDVIRVILLSLYGGVWLDATVLLTSPLPEKYFKKEIFLFQRDGEEKNKEYWENSYAYYFGWSDGFRVNMLSSILFAKKDTPFINMLCGTMLLFCKEKKKLSDYFMFQILFDVLSKGEMAEHNCEIENDCIPHYLMQLCNDNFPYATLKETLAITGIHKLSYKNMDIHRLEQCLRTF